MRVALQALSAVLGGTQSLHTNARDEALALPTEESARLALRTQQVIANESGVADVADPLGGSFLVEAWTAEIRDRARALIAKVDALGGAVAAIEQGFFQREIEDAAYARPARDRGRASAWSSASTSTARTSRGPAADPLGRSADRDRSRSSACARFAPARDAAQERAGARRRCAGTRARTAT